ncbi:MAG: PASTA domain-containing protein [Clostridia bacterium]|nr:PASTA domain-containing protein [Clostridia bacterium]
MLNTEKLCPACMSDNGGEKICPMCGHDSAAQNPENALPVGFRLDGRYVIGKALSSNGEGITYIAWDGSTDTAVHIREYFPLSAAIRNPDYTVSMMPDRKYAFNEGLMEFIERGKSLLHSELPSVIPTNTVFEESGTAYTSFAIIQSISLEDFLERNGGRLRWEQARPLFLPLIDTVAALHKEGIVIGGISPETVMVGRDGKLRFSYLGIRRLRDSSSDLDAELFDGYSAPEQYGIPEMQMGEASDVYALSAVLFRVLIGNTPPVSPSRLEKDTLTIPAHFAEELPRQVLVSLANGMQAHPAKRTATIEAFKNELVYGETAESIRAGNQKRAAEQNAVASKAKSTKKKGASGARYAVVSAVITAAIFLVIGAVVLWIFRDTIFPSKDTEYNTSSDFITESGGPQIGDYDSAVVDSVKTYEVPNLLGTYFSQIEDIEDYEKFKFNIQGKSYSDKYSKGQICAQSIAAGTGVEKETTINVTISLGAKEFKIANVIGLTEEKAKIELLKQGFLYENIKVEEAYDEDGLPGVVLEQSPEFNTKTTAEAEIRIYINSYTGEDEEDTSRNDDYIFN